MSFTLISKKTRTAAKRHRCIWCYEWIEIGEKHVDQVGSFEGEFQACRWHIECDAAAEQFFREEPYESSFFPGWAERGSTAEKGRP